MFWPFLSFWRHRSRFERASLADLQQYGIVFGEVAFEDEPIQLADAYKHLRIDDVDSNGSPDDAWLEAQIPAAREYCELELGRALAVRTVTIATHAFPVVSVDANVGPFAALPFGPVHSIDSIKYLVQQDVTDSNGNPVLDSNGDQTKEVVELTLDTSIYQIDNFVAPNRVVLAFGKTWPAALDTVNSVKIAYTTGYVPAPDTNGHPVLPKAARSAMLLMLAHLYENREATSPTGGAGGLAELPLGVKALLELVPNRERLGMA